MSRVILICTGKHNQTAQRKSSTNPTKYDAKNSGIIGNLGHINKLKIKNDGNEDTSLQINHVPVE